MWFKHVSKWVYGLLIVGLLAGCIEKPQPKKPDFIHRNAVFIATSQTDETTSLVANHYAKDKDGRPKRYTGALLLEQGAIEIRYAYMGSTSVPVSGHGEEWEDHDVYVVTVTGGNIAPETISLVYKGGTQTIIDRDEFTLVLKQKERLNPNFNISYPKSMETTEIPFTFDGTMPIVECKVNGKPAKMILDTACSTVCIFDDKIEHYGIQVVGETNFGYTAAGNRSSEALETFKIKFPDGITMKITNGSLLPSYTHPGIDGILGNTILMTFKALMDYERNVVVLQSPGQEPKEIEYEP